MTEIDLLILEARVMAVIEKEIPIYWQATAEHERDCLQKINIKNYQRDLMRVKLMNNPTLLKEFERD